MDSFAQIVNRSQVLGIDFSTNTEASFDQSPISFVSMVISHRKKAKQGVDTWQRLFRLAEKEQLVSFLYFANDILQTIRSKGSEFVSEYWKVLTAALKVVHETGDENCRKASSRLVEIWEERKVFGLKVQNLKYKMLGENPPEIHSRNPSPYITTGRTLILSRNPLLEACQENLYHFPFGTRKRSQ